MTPPPFDHRAEVVRLTRKAEETIDYSRAMVFVRTADVHARIVASIPVSDRQLRTVVQNLLDVLDAHEWNLPIDVGHARKAVLKEMSR